MKVLLTNPTGNQNSKNLGLAFLHSKKLEKYITTIHFDTTKFYFHFLPKFLKKEFKKRDFSLFSTKMISSNPIKEILLIIFRRLHISKILVNLNNEQIFNDVDKFSANYINYKVTHVYNFQNCAIQTFLKAKL